MKDTFQNIKGTFDILPFSYSADGSTVPSSAAWRYVEETTRSVLERYNFSEIRLPFLEHVALFERSVGEESDIVSKEMFTVPRPKETYVLRPEVTASVMRAFLQHRLELQPAGRRLYYIGPCFRAERPQKGRFRQFHQFGVELIGSADPLADAEVISAMLRVFEAFELSGLQLRLNTLGSGDSRTTYIDRLQEYLSRFERDLSKTSRRRLATNPLRILDTKDRKELEILADAPILLDYVSTEDREHYERVKRYLQTLEISFTEDPLLVRGLDYYCRTAFELESPQLGAQSAVAGGGRYDGLAKAIGWDQELPGVGFAAGIERLFLALLATNEMLPEAEPVDVFIVALGEAARAWAVHTADRLRHSGLRIAFDVRGRSMKAQMKESNRQGARFTLVVGEAEMDGKKVQLKHMKTGDQREISFSRISDELEMLLRDN